ncbi:hypothetical protein [Kibdelosporangium phytohabitans]|uniref:Uncharacterized protein n=1 Tax=Kibdelosporangium phytohabitans TaxID=860235 RepID=A0A0N9I2L4_9PSEU|nr:hypothetical protein [Kibdelosporangium phytohabitans]ALG12881.1 hypothetical protein AOZ06_43900 [Kibdelosporangium phytohabitans]MBE1464585.1 hypothetical protein [Kibdelosporangium phytohabitans]
MIREERQTVPPARGAVLYELGNSPIPRLPIRIADRGRLPSAGVRWSAAPRRRLPVRGAPLWSRSVGLGLGLGWRGDQGFPAPGCLADVRVTA